MQEQEKGARKAETRALAMSFVKPAILVSAFTVVLIYVLFRFESLQHVGAVILNAVNPFLVGLFIAYILNVFLTLFEDVIFGRWTRNPGKIWSKVKRPVCVVLSFAVILLILAAIVLYIVPEVFKSMDTLTEAARVNLPVYIDAVTKWVEGISREFDLDLSKVLQSLQSFNLSDFLSGATEVTTQFISSVVTATVNVASGIFTLVLSVIFAAYFLSGKESLILSAKRIAYAVLPKKVVATVADLGITANSVFSSFVRGQLTECVILGCLCFIGMSIIGFHYALLISCIITLTALIPILGAYIGCGIGAFLLLLVDPMDAVWFVIFLICLQQFEGNVIYPRVVGSTIGLPAVWVMTAITIFSGLFGIMGIILGTPIAAVLYMTIRRSTSNRLYRRGLTNDDLAPGSHPFLTESHFASDVSGRPLSAHVLEKKQAKPSPLAKRDSKPAHKP